MCISNRPSLSFAENADGMLNTSLWSLIVELPRVQVDISFLLLFFIQITVVVKVSALHLDVTRNLCSCLHISPCMSTYYSVGNQVMFISPESTGYQSEEMEGPGYQHR